MGAYRYVDWVLTVPLLLIELILVMGLSPEETVSKSWTLGVASALMVALGYPGEIQDSPSGRWCGGPWPCFRSSMSSRSLPSGCIPPLRSRHRRLQHSRAT